MINIIEVKGVTKKYSEPKGERIIFEDLYFSAKKGDFITIMGPSGCGKTTFLNIISTLDSNYEGDIFFEGNNIKKISENDKDLIRLKKIGYVFQFDSLIEELTVYENITLPLTALKEKKRKDEILTLLENFNMKDIADKYPSEISVGEKQRAALIRAIINSPSLLLADEPTGNLDIENAIRVMEDFKKLHEEGVTIIMVSHNRELVERYSKKLYRIEKKKLNEYEKHS
ncbi:MAG: ABC transporter ATP-binding protein [Elusimicrobiales bacterium]